MSEIQRKREEIENQKKKKKTEKRRRKKHSKGIGTGAKRMEKERDCCHLGKLDSTWKPETGSSLGLSSLTKLLLKAGIQ